MERIEDKNARAQLECVDRTLPLEFAAEFTLPDYRSEISRLLWVRPTVLPPEQFIGGGKIDFSGKICYHALYVGPDGALYGTEQEDGYAFSLPFEGESEGSAFCVDLVPDAVISRVTAPRKLSVRCRMHAHVCGYRDTDLSLRTAGEGTHGEEICRLCESMQNGRLLSNVTQTLTLGAEIPAGENMRLAHTKGTVFLPEVNAASGEIHCRGEVLLSLLVCPEQAEHSPAVIPCRIPFEAHLPMEGVTPAYRARATGVIGEIAVTQEEGRICPEVQLHLSAEAQSEEPVLLCRDVILPGHTAEQQYAEQTFWQAGGCANRNFSVSGELPLSSLGLQEQDEILDVSGDAEISERTADGNRLILSGTVKCHALCRRAGEYTVLDIDFPFRTQSERCGEEVCVSCSVPSCRIAADGEKVRMDAELQLALRGFERAARPVLAQASFTPAGPAVEPDAIELYYPGRGETLWSVAKRYAISPEALANANGLGAEAPDTEDSLQNARHLLIP